MNFGIFRETSQEEDKVRSQSQIRSSGLFLHTRRLLWSRRVGSVVKHDLFTSQYLRVPHPAALLCERSCTLFPSRTHIYLYGRARYRKIFHSSGSSPERELERLLYTFGGRLSHLKTQESRELARSRTQHHRGALYIGKDQAGVRLSIVLTHARCLVSLGAGVHLHTLLEGSAAGCLPG